MATYKYILGRQKDDGTYPAVKRFIAEVEADNKLL